MADLQKIAIHAITNLSDLSAQRTLDIIFINIIASNIMIQTIFNTDAADIVVVVQSEALLFKHIAFKTNRTGLVGLNVFELLTVPLSLLDILL